MADETSETIGVLKLELEEQNPEDPGDRSGMVLSMLEDRGEEACLSVDMGRHCLGILMGEPLRFFLYHALARALGSDELGRLWLIERLRDSHGDTNPGGLGIKFCSRGLGDETELFVACWPHCFGVAHGAVLQMFLARAVARVFGGATKAETRPAEGFTESDRELLRGMRIEDC
ncbi:MAG: hypothetical protein NTW86_22490 [Candidatus Sumerlaeota bacterium]|nr:hypothetical protein [Candidatus Sumerlaeota bacterium]